MFCCAAVSSSLCSRNHKTECVDTHMQLAKHEQKGLCKEDSSICFSKIFSVSHTESNWNGESELRISNLMASIHTFQWNRKPCWVFYITMGTEPEPEAFAAAVYSTNFNGTSHDVQTTFAQEIRSSNKHWWSKFCCQFWGFLVMTNAESNIVTRRWLLDGH